MTNSDRVRFASCMKALGETFGNTVPSKEKVELYFQAMADMSIDQVSGACARLLNTRTITSTFPVPAEIRAAIFGSAEDAATLALVKLEDAIGRYGLYRSVQFDDPVIHMCVHAMGGWPKVCRNEDDEGEAWEWRRKEFVKLYKAMSQNPRVEYPTVLVGIGHYLTDNGYEQTVFKINGGLDETKALPKPECGEELAGVMAKALKMDR